jgi:hypothetical protein
MVEMLQPVEREQAVREVTEEMAVQQPQAVRAVLRTVEVLWGVTKQEEQLKIRMQWAVLLFLVEQAVRAVLVAMGEMVVMAHLQEPVAQGVMRVQVVRVRAAV